MDRLLRLDEAARILGVSVDTLRKWDRLGKIKCVRTSGGHRRVPLSEINRILGIKSQKITRCAIYARVSAYSRQEDLNRQIQILTQYAKEKGWAIIAAIKDIASGMKESRRGLKRLFRLIQQRAIDIVLITYKDRLTRFGFEYIREFFRSYGVEIYVLYDTPGKTEVQELIEDFVAIITSFAGRIYGRRRSKPLIEILNKIKEES